MPAGHQPMTSACCDGCPELSCLRSFSWTHCCSWVQHRKQLSTTVAAGPLESNCWMEHEAATQDPWVLLQLSLTQEKRLCSCFASVSSSFRARPGCTPASTITSECPGQGQAAPTIAILHPVILAQRGEGCADRGFWFAFPTCLFLSKHFPRLASCMK